MELELPRGVADGARVQVAGQGGFDPETGAAGDLAVTVRYALPAGTALPPGGGGGGGGDVCVEVRITMTEALYGFERVISPCGEAVTLSSVGPADFDIEKCLKGMGLGLAGQGPTDRGELRVRIRPAAPTRAEADAILKLTGRSAGLGRDPATPLDARTLSFAA
jgi:DnaJ-class molecular chaperone